MLKVDEAFVKALTETPLTKEQVAALHADIQPPRPWHADKLKKFLTTLTEQTK